LAAGQNNIASNFLLNYDFTYKKGDINWGNKVITRRDLAKTQMLTLFHANRCWSKSSNANE
jgi:hypothetical protein